MIAMLAATLRLAATAVGCDPGDWQCQLPGEKIEVIISRLGPPNSRRPRGEDAIYLWSKGRHETNPHCFLEVVAGPDRVIKSINEDETNGGCAEFEKALSH